MSETVSAAAAAQAEVKNYTEEDIKSQLKPLSENAFVRFFQKIWRWWLGVWYGFCDKHPKGSSLLYKVFFFLVFSYGVTIWQFVVMTFLPYAFASLNNGPAGWPMVSIAAAGGRNFIIFGDEQGWGYFIAFEIAVFTAQCINFPLQRNITYRSHGNPWFQAMWYFIGWVLVSIATNAIWGICNAFLLHWGSPDVLNGLLKTVLTGGVSMVVFFFIFLVIFPDDNKKAKSARAAYEKLKAANAPAEQLAKAEAKMNVWETKAVKSNAEKEYFKAKSQINAKAMGYFATKKNLETAESEEDKKIYGEKLEKAFEDAVNAIKVKNEKEAEFNKVAA